ncbi:MAG: glycogen debranching protein GlgX [Bacteroidetes bacterium]|jgi:glycogen operon protein|nr:glycogen debranching protein GlgX [Bacteroidota bacterium]
MAEQTLDPPLPEPTSSEVPTTTSGLPRPLGVYRRGGGVNFALFSRHATGVWLEFYDAVDDAAPTYRLELTPEKHRTGDIWHIWVKNVPQGQLYGYRVEGPYRPEEGHRFNPYRLLIDPYAPAITHLDGWDFGKARGYDPAGEGALHEMSRENNAHVTPSCVVLDSRTGWEATRPLQHPWSETIIYETHVRGFTVHASAGVEHPGTYRGLTEKIPYLQALGVTAVELMPVHEFNEYEIARVNPLTGEALRNFWGYSPAAFMAPNAAYASAGNRGEQVREFKEMVSAFHEAGIEVLLDVVFNHTAEGNETGPTFSWRGLDNKLYYFLEANQECYRDFTGTGNTLKTHHPVVHDLILDALRHWVVEMHVDGFRFDLASVLGRDEDGNVRTDPPLLDRITQDPVLSQVKMIAEAWDAAGAYQVGQFHEQRWSEWNGRFRDDVRRFWRGDDGMLGAFAQRLTGSADLYEGSGKGPESSINFVTCHDGFTLNDLVSYERKHNEANGEFNRDGTDANYSANYGIEGPTDDPSIQAARTRQVKNFLATLFLSRGVPMLLHGDEFRRTQQGNNNAYCQDNDLGWTLWDRLDAHADIHRFTKEVIAFRKRHPVLCRMAFYRDDEVRWLGPHGQTPRWDASSARALGLQVEDDDGAALLLLFNASGRTVNFAVPTPPDGHTWHRAIDTRHEAPADLFTEGNEERLDGISSYRMGPQSTVVLVGRKA